MKRRAVEKLMVVAAATFLTGACAGVVAAQESRSRDAGRDASRRSRDLADMAVTQVTALGNYKLRVVVANLGTQISRPCLVNAGIYVDGAQDERFWWIQNRTIGGLEAGGQLTLDFDTASPIYGHRVTAYVFQCRGVDAMAANDRKTVSIPAQSEPPKPPPAVLVRTPKISPDLAATEIYFEGGQVVGVVKNVGDRTYLAAGSNYQDSFDRKVTLRRVKRVGAQTHTETVHSFDMPHAGVGESLRFGFPRPTNDPAATEYTWVLVISGGDPDSNNNSFAKVEKVQKGKMVRID
jgi:hypothetical protein